jgi:hypothetical protein
LIFSPAACLGFSKVGDSAKKKISRKDAAKAMKNNRE